MARLQTGKVAIDSGKGTDIYTQSSGTYRRDRRYERSMRVVRERGSRSLEAR